MDNFSSIRYEVFYYSYLSFSLSLSLSLSLPLAFTSIHHFLLFPFPLPILNRLLLSFYRFCIQSLHHRFGCFGCPRGVLSRRDRPANVVAAGSGRIYLVSENKINEGLSYDFINQIECRALIIVGRRLTNAYQCVSAVCLCVCVWVRVRFCDLWNDFYVLIVDARATTPSCVVLCINATHTLLFHSTSSLNNAPSHGKRIIHRYKSNPESFRK